MSEDKVRRKDLYGSVRAVYTLEKLPDVSRHDLIEVGCYRMVSELTLMISRARVLQLHMARVDPEWSHSMAHALALNTRMWPRGDVLGLGLTDEDVGLLRG
jgi:hypothetical protein